MSGFNQSQISDLNEARQKIRKLPESQRQNEFANLIEKAQEILGFDSPYMAPFYYDYGVFILSKIESSIQLFDPQAPLHPDEYSFFAEKDDCYDQDVTEYQNYQKNYQSLEKVQLNYTKEKEEKNQNQNQKKHQYQEDQLTDIEICYQNFETALQIYERQLEKIQNGECSPLDRRQVLKYKLHIHANLGQLFALKQQFNDSIQEFKTVIELASYFDHPETQRIISEAHFNIGNALLNKKRLVSAQNIGYDEIQAIEQFILAIKSLVRYINDVESYDTSKWQIPTLDNPKVDRYHYLQAPKDSEIISEIKQCISMILNKIESTSEIIRIENVRSQRENQNASNSEETIQVQKNKESQIAIVENSIVFSNRKRVPEPLSEEQGEEKIKQILTRLNPEAPSQELLKLRNQRIQEEIKDYEKIKFSPDFQCFAILKAKVLSIYDIEGQIIMKISDQYHEHESKIMFQNPVVRDIKDFFWSENISLYQIVVLYDPAEYYTVYTIGGEQSFSIGYIVDGLKKNYAFGSGPNSHFFVVNSQVHPTIVQEREFLEICIFSSEDSVQWESLNYYRIPVANIGQFELTRSNQLILFGGSSTLRVYIYDLLDQSLKILIQDEELRMTTQKTSNQGEYLAIGCDDGKLIIFKTLQWSIICEFEIQRRIETGPTVIVISEQNEIFEVWRYLTFKLPHTNHDQKQDIPDSYVPPYTKPINKIQFSPRSSFVGVQSLEMPCSIFLYNLKRKSTIVINLENKVKDFKWLKLEEGPETLLIIGEMYKVLMWRNTGNEGQIVRESIPQDRNIMSNEMQISEMQVGQKGRVIVYMNDRRRFLLTRFGQDHD